MSAAVMVWWLLAGHFMADYPLQGDTTAREKSRHSTTPLQQYVPWYYWLTAHALMHGSVVLLVTGSIGLALAEAGAHWVIDFGKCESWFSIHTDQALHVACKLLWLALAQGWLVA